MWRAPERSWSSEQSQCRRLIFDPSLETWGCARELEDPQLPHRAQQGRGETDHQNSTTGLASAEIINAIQMISGRFCWGSRGFSGFLYWSWPKTMPPRRSWPRQRKRPPPCRGRDEVATSERRAPEMPMRRCLRHDQLWLATSSSRLRGRDIHSLTPTTLPAAELRVQICRSISEVSGARGDGWRSLSCLCVHPGAGGRTGQ